MQRNKEIKNLKHKFSTYLKNLRECWKKCIKENDIIEAEKSILNLSKMELDLMEANCEDYENFPAQNIKKIQSTSMIQESNI